MIVSLRQPLSRRRAALLATLASLATARHAIAQRVYPPVTDRNFALDLYSGGVIGSVRVIGMGGTSIALAEGSVGTLSNAAAVAVRRMTKSSTWAWDFHLDGQLAAFGSDFDNNGLLDTEDASSQLATAGLVIQYGPWGFGISATASSTLIVEDDGDDSTEDDVLQPQGTIGRVVVGYSFGREEHTMGLSLRFGSLAMLRPTDGVGDLTMFTVAGPSAEYGYLWRPPGTGLRVGGNVALPVRTHGVTVGDCDPTACEGYILPARVEVPWMISAGVAYRLGPTPWNQRVQTQYRDERALVVGSDVVLTGPVDDGHGLEAFARHQLQRSGEHPVVTVRVGAELELFPGWLRVRAGSYWEPARFEGASGRLHGTAGADVRLVQFSLLDKAYRLQLAATADVADRYGNTGVSIGFWH